MSVKTSCQLELSVSQHLLSQNFRSVKTCCRSTLPVSQNFMLVNTSCQSTLPVDQHFLSVNTSCQCKWPLSKQLWIIAARCIWRQSVCGPSAHYRQRQSAVRQPVPPHTQQLRSSRRPWILQIWSTCCPETSVITTTNVRCVMTLKNANLIDTAAETWNRVFVAQLLTKGCCIELVSQLVGSLVS
jgi:hypothetical protein